MGDEYLGHFKDCEWLTDPNNPAAICECLARVGQALFGMNCTLEPRRRRDGLPIIVNKVASEKG